MSEFIEPTLEVQERAQAILERADRIYEWHYRIRPYGAASEDGRRARALVIALLEAE